MEPKASKEQARNRGNNRYVTHLSETKLLLDWAKETSLTESILRSRLDKPDQDFLGPRKVSVEAQHGTYSRYVGPKHRCRCNLCVGAMRSYEFKRRKNLRYDL